MPELTVMRNFNLKVLFLVHYTFISLSCMGSWTPSAYLFYNFILILLLMWGIYHEQSHDPVRLAIVVNGISIILDIFLLIMCFPGNGWARDKFSGAIAIIHLFMRPFSIIFLIKNLEERSGSSDILNGLLSRRNESYEDIDRNVRPASTNTQNYDFPTAEQI